MNTQPAGSLSDHAQVAIADLCRRHSVQRLELFGSATTGTFADTSDYDFLVEFQSLPEGQRAHAYFGLLEDLRALLQRRVDLVVESAIRNPYFREAIAGQRRVVYGR